MGLTQEQTQRVKTAFLSYAQGQPKITEAMIDQFICGAIPGLSWEQLQQKKSAKKGAADGYDRGAFFALVNTDPAYINFITQYFPPAPPDPKEPEVDALALKAAKGFWDLNRHRGDHEAPCNRYNDSVQTYHIHCNRRTLYMLLRQSAKVTTHDIFRVKRA